MAYRGTDDYEQFSVDESKRFCPAQKPGKQQTKIKSRKDSIWQKQRRLKSAARKSRKVQWTKPKPKRIRLLLARGKWEVVEPAVGFDAGIAARCGTCIRITEGKCSSAATADTNTSQTDKLRSGGARAIISTNIA